MEARLSRFVALAAVCCLINTAVARANNGYRTANFIVNAPTHDIAKQIGDAAEKYRRELAIEWIGKPFPNWSQPCPIVAQVGDNLGAGGATSFLFEHGEVYGWQMTIQGSLTRILDSVLPHEVTHTIFATHFRRALPRWADEGACTTVEHTSEKAKQQNLLVQFLRSERGIPFNRMFAMKEYPHDVMPLYSQGYSLARYLIAQRGKKAFLEFLADGMRDENWNRAIHQHYGYQNLATLQNTWLTWVRQGSPAVEQTGSTDALASHAPRRQRPADAIIRNANGAAATNATAAAPTRPAADVELAQATAPRSSAIAAPEPRGGAAAAIGSRDVAAASGSRGGWRSRGDQPEPAAKSMELASTDSALPQPLEADDSAPHQVTRPQPFEQPRQVILEWSRSHDPPAMPGPDTSASVDSPSVYARTSVQ